MPNPDVEVAKYKITGLVDVFDEQGNITGQLPIGSIQELPVEVGTKAVAEGTAEAVADEGDSVSEAGQSAETSADVATPTEKTGDEGEAAVE